MDTVSGTKTTTYRSSSGEALWSISVTGMFSFVGTSVTCRSSKLNITIYDSAWKTYSTNTSKSGNCAKATATIKEYFLGFETDSITKSISLYCSIDGNLY